MGFDKSDKEKSQRERTGSYQHLTVKQEQSAIRQSEHFLREQKEALDKVDEVLNQKELAREIKKADLESDNHISKMNERSVESEATLTGFKPINTIMQPKHIAAARRKVYNAVMKNLIRAEEVLNGKRKWSNQQVTLFSKMMNKVLPDLNHTVSDVQHSFTGSVKDLPIEDLMRIAMEETQIVDADYEEIPEQDVSVQRPYTQVEEPDERPARPYDETFENPMDYVPDSDEPMPTLERKSRPRAKKRPPNRPKKQQKVSSRNRKRVLP